MNNIKELSDKIEQAKEEGHMPIPVVVEYSLFKRSGNKVFFTKQFPVGLEIDGERNILYTPAQIEQLIIMQLVSNSVNPKMRKNFQEDKLGPKELEAISEFNSMYRILVIEKYFTPKQ